MQLLMLDFEYIKAETAMQFLIDTDGKKWLPQMGKGRRVAGKEYPVSHFVDQEGNQAKEIKVILNGQVVCLDASDLLMSLVAPEGWRGVEEV